MNWIKMYRVDMSPIDLSRVESSQSLHVAKVILCITIDLFPQTADFHRLPKNNIVESEYQSKFNSIWYLNRVVGSDITSHRPPLISSSDSWPLWWVLLIHWFRVRWDWICMLTICFHFDKVHLVRCLIKSICCCSSD